MPDTPDFDRLFQKFEAAKATPDVEPRSPFSGALMASLTLSVFSMAFAHAVSLSPKVPEAHKKIEGLLFASVTVTPAPTDELSPNYIEWGGSRVGESALLTSGDFRTGCWILLSCWQTPTEKRINSPNRKGENATSMDHVPSRRGPRKRAYNYTTESESQLLSVPQLSVAGSVDLP